MTTIFTPHAHPGRTLYRLWDKVIDANGGHNAAYGAGSIWRQRDTKVIQYGHLHLSQDGRFRISRGMRGHRARVFITKGTFLGFRHWRSTYNWFVDFDESTYWQSQHTIELWQRPVAYISEKVLGGEYWRDPLMWFDLVHDQNALTGWRAEPAKSQYVAGADRQLGRGPLKGPTKTRWDKFTTLREERYRLMEARQTGVALAPRTVSARTPSVIHDGKRLEGAEAVTAITALLDVSMPAKFTPRLKEAAR